MNYLTQQCCFLTSEPLLIWSFYWLPEPALLSRADTLQGGCDWWQVPAARAASPSHQPQVYTPAHAVFTEVKQAACMLYLPKKYPRLGGMNPKEELWNHFLLLLLEKGRAWMSPVQTHLVGRSPDRVPAEPAWRYVVEATSEHDFWSYSLPLISAFRLINFCGKREKKGFGHT